MPKRRRIDIGPIAGDHTPAVQPVQPCLHGAAGDVQAAGRLEHPDARLGGEQLNELGIQLVDHTQLLCSVVMLFFSYDTATTDIYTLSLHDALPSSRAS